MFDQPVFIFAASWRTGSTLLQRMFNGTGELLMYGEPQTLWALEKSFSQAYRVCSENVGQWREFRRSGPERAWAPNLNPEVHNGRAGFKALFDTMYGKPSRDLGYNRWGFKEVRKDAFKNYQFMSTLYPESKTIFLIRNPIDTFISVRNADFYSQFTGPYMPLRVWCRNTISFLNTQHENSEGSILVGLEDLLLNPDKFVNDICQHCDIENQEGMHAALIHRVGGSKRDNLSQHERSQLISVISEEFEKAPQHFKTVKDLYDLH